MDEQSVDVTICDKGSCASSSFTEVSVFCNNKASAAVPATCESTVFQNSLVYCIAGACRNSDFDTAGVVCVEGGGDSDSCASSSFHQSKVGCYDSCCGSSVFEASEVICDGFLSCLSATFDDCSCCDGNGCPDELPSCGADPVTFCSGREINGLSCAALGNPICNGLSGPTILPAAPATPNPPSPQPPTETTSAPQLAVTTIPAPSPNAPPSRIESPPVMNADIPVTSPTAQSTSTPVHTECSGVSEVTAVSGIQITIPPCTYDVGKPTVTTWPRNGSVAVRDNGSVLYTPNVGFVGLDVIGLETCNPGGECFDATVNISVSASEESSSPKSDDGGSQAYLAALVIIPIVGCVAGYLIYRRRKSESSNIGRHGSRPNVSTFNQSVSGPSLSLHDEVHVAHQRIPAQPAPPQYPENNQSGRPPTFKDQVRAVDPQRPGSATDQQPGCDDGGGGSFASLPPRQDPPTEPRYVNAVAKPMHGGVRPADFYEPHNKDQCRNAPVEAANNDDPPLASAVVVEETVKRAAPNLPRIDL